MTNTVGKGKLKIPSLIRMQMMYEIRYRINMNKSITFEPSVMTILSLTKC